MKKILVFLLLPFFAFADGAINSWQPLQPGDSNYVARNSGYHYGYPAYGAFQPNVVAQWTFNESSGNIVDRVSAITLVPEFGPMTYSQTAPGIFGFLAPGILFPGGGTFGDFKKGSSEATMAIGTNDFVIEAWIKQSVQSATTHLASDYGASETKGWGFQVRAASDTKMKLIIRADDTTVGDMIWDLSQSLQGDGYLHKLRCACTRTVSCVLKIDGQVQAVNTDGLSAIVGKTISSYGPFIGSRSGGNEPFSGTIYEFRMTIGNATNSSGGPGGG